MNKEEEFEKLWKVEAIRNLMKLEEEKELDDGKVIRSSKADHERTLKFIKYGFEEGIKKGRQLVDET